jgi:hypothetical protein
MEKDLQEIIMKYPKKSVIVIVTSIKVTTLVCSSFWDIMQNKNDYS